MRCCLRSDNPITSTVTIPCRNHHVSAAHLARHADACVPAGGSWLGRRCQLCLEVSGMWGDLQFCPLPANRKHSHNSHVGASRIWVCEVIYSAALCLYKEGTVTTNKFEQLLGRSVIYSPALHLYMEPHMQPNLTWQSKPRVCGALPLHSRISLLV